VALVPFLFGITGRATLTGSQLRRLLGEFGLSPDAARALLSRMRRHGQLVGDPRGRGAQYRLAGDFAHTFERVRDQATVRPTAWTGHFQALLYQVPEQHRSFRDELRRSAVLCGYGILQPGVLIAPTDRSGPLSALLANQPEGAQVWLSTLGMTPAEAARAAGIAWDLADLADRYHWHIGRLSKRLTDRTIESAAEHRHTPGTSPTGAESLRDYAETLIPALTDTLRESGLPPALLPQDWPGPKLRQILNQYTATFDPQIAHHLEGFLD